MAGIIMTARSAGARIIGRNGTPAESGRPAGEPALDLRKRWSALDSKHERLVDASHPLLADLTAEC